MITREIAEATHPTKPLGEVAAFLDHKRRPVKQSERKEGPFPYYGANGLQGTIDSFIFDEPLILLAEDGGHFDNPDRGIAYEISGKTWVNNHAHVLKPQNGDLDLTYLRRVLESYDVRPFINGSTRSKLTKAQAERIPIPLPPLDEQRRIAAILDKADALRRMRKRALDLLENAKNSFVELALRKASRGKTEALGEYLNFITTGGRNWSKYYSLEGSRFIRSLDVQMNSISQEDPVYVAAPENAEARRTRTHKGDVLLTVTGSRIGRVAELPAGLTGSYVSQHVAILRPNLAKLRPKFLSFFLSSREGQRQIQKWQYGQTKPGLNFKQIEGFLIPKISVDQQVRFEGIAERFEALLSVQKDDCMRLTSLFSSLQHRAFSGQL
jgi:type I restriction enzyme S subunit